MTTVIPFPNSRTPGHPVVEHMQRHGIPVTRENFIEWNWPDGKPDPWEADHEADLPMSCKTGRRSTRALGGRPEKCHGKSCRRRRYRSGLWRSRRRRRKSVACSASRIPAVSRPRIPKDGIQ
jgi:hypothetical protein